jgi:hypothetical protein
MPFSQHRPQNRLQTKNRCYALRSCSRNILLGYRLIDLSKRLKSMFCNVAQNLRASKIGLKSVKLPVLT